MEKQRSQYPEYYSTSSSCAGDENGNSNYQCGFMIHVQGATLLIGAVGSFACSGVLASLLKVGAAPDQCVLAGMILCSYALLVMGWSVRMPSFYWPFLLINPLLICLTAVFCTFPAFDLLMAPLLFPSKVDFDHLSPKKQLLMQVTQNLRLMEFAASLCGIVILVYFQSIVFRAHNWQRKQNKLDEQLVIIGDHTP